jgi:hypothetical protein
MTTDLAEQLLGSWRLHSWTIVGDDTVRTPFGGDPMGTLIYSADGRMVAVVARSDRSPLPGNKPSDAGAVELAAAMLSFFCYSGRWSIDGTAVIHSVDLALNPGMVGTDQRREIELSADGLGLTLSADEQTTRGQRRHALAWKRYA